jgi:hypothetical protein
MGINSILIKEEIECISSLIQMLKMQTVRESSVVRE